MRTNSFIKLITSELNRQLSEKNMTNRNVRRKELQAYMDKMKGKIELFVRDQIQNNTVALIKCQCKHLEDVHKGAVCKECDCVTFTPRGRTPLILALHDDVDWTEEVLHAA